MPEEFGDNKLTQAEADELMSPLENDLTALFSYMRDDMLETLLDYEGTPEGFIDAILGPLQEEGGPVAKDMHRVEKAARKLQGRIEFQGLNISIENRRGSVRSGVDSDGHEWSIEMKFPYGYILKSEATDGEHVDCYVGDSRDSKRVFVIHQNNPDTGEYDEDKVMLGFDSPAAAKNAYLSQYDRPGFFGDMIELTIDEFKELLQSKKGGKIMKSKCDVKKVMSPGPGEDEQKFVSRCISHEMGKGKDKKQAAAICYSIFRESKKDMVIRKATEVIKSITERIKGK